MHTYILANQWTCQPSIIECMFVYFHRQQRPYSLCCHSPWRPAHQALPGYWRHSAHTGGAWSEATGLGGCQVCRLSTGERVFVRILSNLTCQSRIYPKSSVTVHIHKMYHKSVPLLPIQYLHCLSAYCLCFFLTSFLSACRKLMMIMIHLILIMIFTLTLSTHT